METNSIIRNSSGFYFKVDQHGNKTRLSSAEAKKLQNKEFLDTLSDKTFNTSSTELEVIEMTGDTKSVLSQIKSQKGGASDLTLDQVTAKFDQSDDIILGPDPSGPPGASIDNWYDAYSVTKDHILESCGNRHVGFLTDQKRDAINTWGQKMLQTSYRQERMVDKGASEAEKKPIVRPAAKAALTGCVLKTEERDSDVLGDEKELCKALVCSEPLTGVIKNEADFDHVKETGNDGRLNDDHKMKLDRCKVINSHICTRPSRFGDNITSETHKHIKNPGQGDCLFLAVLHYLHLESQKDNDRIYTWSDPDIYNATSGLTNEITEEWTGKGMIERGLTIDWLRANKNKTIEVVGNTIVRDFVLGSALDDHTMSGKKCVELMSVEVVKFSSESKPGLEDGTTFNMNGIGFEDELDDNRRQLLSYMSDLESYKYSHKEVFRTFARTIDDLLDRLYNVYLEYMSKISSYGGESEIYAISERLNRSIHIYQDVGITDSSGNHIYALVAQYEPTDSDPENPISIHNQNNHHYEILYPVTPKLACADWTYLRYLNEKSTGFKLALGERTIPPVGTETPDDLDPIIIDALYGMSNEDHRMGRTKEDICKNLVNIRDTIMTLPNIENGSSRTSTEILGSVAVMINVNNCEEEKECNPYDPDITEMEDDFLVGEEVAYDPIWETIPLFTGIEDTKDVDYFMTLQDFILDPLNDHDTKKHVKNLIYQVALLYAEEAAADSGDDSIIPEKNSCIESLIEILVTYAVGEDEGEGEGKD